MKVYLVMRHYNYGGDCPTDDPMGIFESQKKAEAFIEDQKESDVAFETKVMLCTDCPLRNDPHRHSDKKAPKIIDTFLKSGYCPHVTQADFVIHDGYISCIEEAIDFGEYSSYEIKEMKIQ